MRVLTRSKIIRTAINTVLRRMPHDDRKIVEGFVNRVMSCREWETDGLDNLSVISAAMLPLWTDRTDFSKYDCQIQFNLPVARLFTAKALTNIVAHEFAHVRIAANLGDGWYEKMKSREGYHERIADQLASSWGFPATLHHRERKKQVLPTIYARESQIMRKVSARLAAENEAVKSRFDKMRRY